MSCGPDYETTRLHGELWNEYKVNKKGYVHLPVEFVDQQMLEQYDSNEDGYWRAKTGDSNLDAERESEISSWNVTDEREKSVVKYVPILIADDSDTQFGTVFAGHKIGITARGTWIQIHLFNPDDELVGETTFTTTYTNPNKDGKRRRWWQHPASYVGPSAKVQGKRQRVAKYYNYSLV